MNLYIPRLKVTQNFERDLALTQIETLCQSSEYRVRILNEIRDFAWEKSGIKKVAYNIIATIIYPFKYFSALCSQW